MEVQTDMKTACAEIRLVGERADKNHMENCAGPQPQFIYRTKHDTKLLLLQDLILYLM